MDWRDEQSFIAAELEDNNPTSNTAAKERYLQMG